MASKDFYKSWKPFAVGSGLTILVVTVIGSAVDKNPIRTALLGICAFFVINAVYAGFSLLVDKPKSGS